MGLRFEGRYLLWATQMAALSQKDGSISGEISRQVKLLMCRRPNPSPMPLGVHSHDIVHKGKSADRRQTTQALMLAVMIIEVKPGAKPANTVA